MINKPLRKPKSGWRCDICDRPIRNAMFMVKDDLWFAVGMEKKVVVHYECFVKELGRLLIYQDFTFAEINDVWTAGMKLPCCYCLFVELKERYARGIGVDATVAKLKLVHFGGRESPSNHMIVDRCTCDELP